MTEARRRRARNCHALDISPRQSNEAARLARRSTGETAMAPSRPSPGRRFAPPSRAALALGGALLAFGLAGAAADPMTAGERAYARANYIRAAKLLAPEAEGGRAKAQTYLGFMYANGLGVAQDFSIAAKWLTLAAQNGVPEAQYLLGGLFDRGQGVKHDQVMAEIWFDLAAANAEPGNRSFWAGMRDAVAGKLTRAELAEAERRAAAWAPPAAP
jgi:uncharacterized protein